MSGGLNITDNSSGDLPSQASSGGNSIKAGKKTFYNNSQPPWVMPAVIAAGLLCAWMVMRKK